MLRSASVVLLLLVGGCTPGAAGSPEKPAAASTEAPRLGACRQLTPADVTASTNDSAEVGCAAEHTAQTFAVGSFPAEVAAAGEESPRLGAYVYDRCQSRFKRFLGADDSLMLRSTMTWAWFRSSADAWKQGAHSWRCDVVGGGEKSAAFTALPRTARGLLLGKPDDRWLVCVDGPTVSGSAKIPCSRPHTWRAVSTIVLGKKADAYPGDRLSEVRTRDFCRASVGALLSYPLDYDFGYTWFHAAEWKAGNRRSVCWARTTR